MLAQYLDIYWLMSNTGDSRQMEKDYTMVHVIFSAMFLKNELVLWIIIEAVLSMIIQWLNYALCTAASDHLISVCPMGTNSVSLIHLIHCFDPMLCQMEENGVHLNSRNHLNCLISNGTNVVHLIGLNHLKCVLSIWVEWSILDIYVFTRTSLSELSHASCINYTMD